MRILIVEDDALIALLTEDLLTDAGHTVVGLAATRMRALQLAQQTHPDLALVDIRLADGSTGLDVAQDFSKSHIPIIIVSALPQRLAATDPTLPFIEKPFTSEILIGAISEIGRSITHSKAA